jgi:hypothetical protein
MKRTLVITLALLGLAGVVAWYLLSGATWTFSFSEQQLAELLAKRFPVHKTYLVLIGVHYENPRVRLTDGSSDIGVGVDARVDVLVDRKELRGSADLVTRIAYDAGSGTFVLHDARLASFEVPGVSEEVADRVKDVANVLAAEAVSGIPVYKLRPTDVKTTLARLVLKSVVVRDGLLHVEVGL